MIKIENLSASYGGGDVISDISFELGEAEILVIVGKSGSGKSTLLKSLVPYFEKPYITSGSLDLPWANGKISMIFQDPSSSFNPIRTYKKQFVETLKANGFLHGTIVDMYKKIFDVFENLGLNDAERILNSCPCELSGGMNQRIALALAMLCEKKLLLADEPTSALDVISQKQVADELKKLRDISGISQIIVTHDHSLAYYLADKVIVLENGRIVRSGTKEILK